MIIFCESDGKTAVVNKKVPADTPIHVIHFKDHYPLCWPMTKTGEFAGSFDDVEITCKDCLRIMKEE